MTVVLVVVAALLVVVIVGAVVARRRRQRDGVATFRRQIDALSPQARRPVVDEVQRLEDQAAKAPEDEEPR